jgi:hypothetical protein
MIDLLVATRVKNKTSGQISLTTVALNFFRVQRPVNNGFLTTIGKIGIFSDRLGDVERWESKGD